MSDWFSDGCSSDRPSGARELGNAELLPVGMGCHAGDALEQATEECVAFVADLPADFLHGCGGALQAPLGVFNPQSLDVLDGSQPGGGSKPPLECTLGETGRATGRAKLCQLVEISWVSAS